ncbi:hypothetical protein ACHAXR_004626 [Thalassiosira sp. AJA248-18]
MGIGTHIWDKAYLDSNNNSFAKKWKLVQLNSTHDAAYEKWAGRCCSRYINTHSGCKISRWYYSIGDEVVNPNPRVNHRDCDAMPKHRQLIHPSEMKENDTVYVTFIALQQFVDRILDKISVDFVLISGQNDFVAPVADATIEKLLNNTHVMHFFCQNLQVYGGKEKRHPSVHPFPYGLKGYPETTNSKGTTIHSSIISPIYHNKAMENSMNKSTFIYAGPLTKTNAIRKEIPQEDERLSHGEFFARMANAKYVLSPNGDRPDCHCHYEAIFLGTVPITQLDPFLYRHLTTAPVVFGNSDWNLTSLTTKLDPKPVVNRNMIFEEYWMDWVDHIVGIDLNWSNDLNSGINGFQDGPHGSWAPISDTYNSWISVSDMSNLCIPYANMNAGDAPEWGVSGEGNAGITRHIACCLNISIASDSTSNPEHDAISNATRKYKLKWFDRESGWKGTTYDGAVKFCSMADMKLCPYEAYCPPGGSKKLSVDT